MLGALDSATMLEILPDAVVVADAKGRIVYANPAVAALLGHEVGALVGQPLTVLMPERFRAAHAAGFARFLTTGEGELIGATTQIPALHGSGEEIPVDLTLSPLHPDGSDGGVVVGVLRDASTTVLLERQLEVSRYLTAILRVTEALTGADDAEHAFRRLLPSLCEQLDWDAASLWQSTADGDALVHGGTWTRPGQQIESLHRATAGSRFRIGEGLPGLAWRRRAPVVIADVGTDGRFLRQPAARADGLRTGVAFPVRQGESILAVVELFSRTVRPVPPELLAVLAGAGRQIGQFVGRLRAEAEVRRLADTLQRSLLPSQLPVVPGVDLAARYRPGGDHAVVGGDTYDVMPLPDGGWMVLVADVCGTGPVAAASTALTRHTARAVAADNGPAEILAAIDSALLRESTDGPAGFVTACCLLLLPGPAGAQVRLTLAGHPQPMLRRPDGTVLPVGCCGPPMGILPGATWSETLLELGAGDTLVLYTDGVTEARDASGQQFGEDAFADLLAATTGSSAEVTAEAVLAAVDRQLAGSSRPADDLAVLVLRV